MGSQEVFLGLSPFLLLCFKARMGLSAPCSSSPRSLHSICSGLNNHFYCFPAFKAFPLHLTLCHFSFQSLSYSASVK